MLNYMRSEWYRIFHTKSLWVFTAVLTVLILSLNVMLFLMGSGNPDFPYSTVRFSFSMLLSSMLIFGCSGVALASILFADKSQGGIMKNAASYGISRTRILVGKCIISSAAAFASMVVILAVYVGSAVLLLDGEWVSCVQTVIIGVLVNLPFAVACVILYISFQQFLGRESLAILAWIGVIYILPLICLYAGFRIDLLAKIAEWLPYNYLQLEVQASASQYDCLWMNSQGMAKCLISGFVGIGVFLFLGFCMNHRKEL